MKSSMNKDPKASILVVEDEESLSNALKLNLELEGYEVSVASDGKQAIDRFKQEYFDCIILDIMLPEMDGLMVCESIRLQNSKVPIMFLSAKSAGADRVAGLKKGGDDYMTKPFNLEELLLRVDKLILKNNQLSKPKENLDIVEFGPNKVDFQAQECIDLKGNKHSLTKKELMLLKLLVENKNEVVTREHILKTVWGYNVYPSTRTIDNFILTFRKYFEADSRNPNFFHSVRGVGYKFTM